MSIYRFTVH